METHVTPIQSCADAGAFQTAKEITSLKVTREYQVKMNYNFNPETMYQPEPPVIESFDRGDIRYYKDGSVESLDDFWPVTKSDYKGWNTYEWKGCGFRAYRVIANHFWPMYPKELNCVDHINRCRGEDAFSNLRRISTSLNNLNQYRKNVKGYRYETSEWLSKANGWRIKRKMSPIILKEPPRNKYVANITYKGKPHELGVFDNPEDATECYLAKKEGFIQDKLRNIWSEFLAARGSG